MAIQNRRQYEALKAELTPGIVKGGPMAVLIATLDICTQQGKLREAAAIEKCCVEIGAAYAVQYFPSKSDPSKTYKTIRWPSNELSCDCRGWCILKKDHQGNPKPRTCTHCDQARAHPERWESVIGLPSEKMLKLKEMAEEIIVTETSTTQVQLRRRIIFDEDE